MNVSLYRYQATTGLEQFQDSVSLWLGGSIRALIQAETENNLLQRATNE